MMLLGDVSEVQEVRKRPCHWHGGLDRHARQFGAERVEIVGVACAGPVAPARLGESPHRFDAIEERRSLLLSERLPQQFAQ